MVLASIIYGVLSGSIDKIQETVLEKAWSFRSRQGVSIVIFIFLVEGFI